MEAAKFLNEHMGLRLSLSEVELLAEHTEGWAVGLQMAALALRILPDPAHKSADFVHTFSGSHRFVLDYLMDEVFSRLPAGTQSFLLGTAILDRFCADLCAEVLGERTPKGSEEPVDRLLVSLHNANLFLIPLDEEGVWYRYHHLFSELLRSRLRQEASPEKIAEQQRRASAWFAARGSTDEAINYSLQAGDFEQAASMVEACAQQVISSGRQATLQRWLAGLPAAVLMGRPRLRMYQAWAHFMGGEPSTAIKILEETSQSLDGLPESGELQALKRELVSILAMSSLTAGDAQRVVQLARQALERMPETELTPRARLLFALGMGYSLAGDRRYSTVMAQALELARQAGNLYLAASILFNQAFGAATFLFRLRSAWQLYQEIIDLCTPAAGDTLSFAAGLGLIGQAGIALEWNDLDKAARLLEQGMDLCRQGGLTIADFSALLTRARLAQAKDDLPGASSALDEAARKGAIFSSQMNAILLAQAQVRLNLAAGQIDAAARWARGEELPVAGDLPALMQEIWDVSQASVLLAQGQLGEALARLEKLIPQADSAGRVARLLEGSLVQALALHALHRDAFQPLQHALSLGQPQGATRLFLEAGAPLRDLLLAYRSRLGELAAEADRLLHLLGEPASPVPAPAPDLIEALTPREMDVLRLLYAGKSNQEIADALFFSLSAVKKHTGSIYGKLGVASRAQAIAKARELRLL